MQVQQHAEKLQKAKETTSRAKLRALMPHLGQATLEVALRECQWDADRAAALLRRFAIVHAKELSGIEKVGMGELSWEFVTLLIACFD